MSWWWSSSRRPRRRSSYRSKRSVARKRPPETMNWTKTKVCVLMLGILVFCIVTLGPMLVLETLERDLTLTTKRGVVGLSSLLHKSQRLSQTSSAGGLHSTPKPPPPVQQEVRTSVKSPPKQERTKPKEVVSEKTSSLKPVSQEQENVARGVSGLPLDQTPALLGAKRAHITCDGESIETYWNDPVGTRDLQFKSYFSDPPGRFLTFEPDPGGWNNVRMSLETIVVLAAATGRTLVLPPKQPLYLLGTGEEHARSFGSFFQSLTQQKRVPVITMTEFVQQHGSSVLGLRDVQPLMPIADMCIFNPTSNRTCDTLNNVLRNKGIQPQMEGNANCLIFSQDVFDGGSLTTEEQVRVNRFCGKRKAVLYNHDLHDPPLLHWQTSSLDYRLLNHFYTFCYFTNPVADNYYKRLVRDVLHYRDEIYCAAEKIVSELEKPFSTLHVRRGDFQYKEAKLSAQEWYNNTKELFPPNEILYVATDERNKTWFDPLAKHYTLRFLSDYWDTAKLGSLDDSYLGIVDAIVASRGRVFVGTWFSTFSGYINRLRGYQGMSMKDSWYSFLPRKTVMHKWEYPHGNYPAREFPIGWVAIDGDSLIEHEAELPQEEKPIDRKVPHLTLSDLKEDTGFADKPLARGIAGVPASESPTLNGASRAHVQCDINVDSLAYWNDPQGTRDVNFQSPFKVKGDNTKYISFVPDRGGWNNIRMSMEIIFVIAAATGRTLVLPPAQPLYRLNEDKGNRHRGFANFFPLHTTEFQKRVPTITMEEFVRREGGKDGRLPVPEKNRTTVEKASSYCIKMKKSDRSCDAISDYLTSVSYMPEFRAQDGCVVFDEDVYNGKQISAVHKRWAYEFCGDRNVTYWKSDMDDPVLVHFRAGDKRYRLLTHYYLMLHFTDPAIDHYFKRFVRDFLHYHDAIWCAAGKIVKAVQAEGARLGFSVDEEGAGGYSAMHIRRGDLQYKRVKIPAEEWINNTQEIWLPNEIIYIATDERNKSWFNPIVRRHPVRFLDDYWDLAGLSDLDPNYMGMIDTIVSSRARAFAGTWFSTFSGYINRMRGHHGMTMMDSWYSFLPRKSAVHEWKNISGYAYAYENQIGWIGIDADVPPSSDKF